MSAVQPMHREHHRHLITRDGVIGNFPESLSGVTGSSPVPAITFVLKVQNKVFFVGTCSFFLSHSSKEESEVHLRGQITRQSKIKSGCIAAGNSLIVIDMRICWDCCPTLAGYRGLYDKYTVEHLPNSFRSCVFLSLQVGGVNIVAREFKQKEIKGARAGVRSIVERTSRNMRRWCNRRDTADLKSATLETLWVRIPSVALT